jgi:iron(III) transport system substrate-binding protein
MDSWLPRVRVRRFGLGLLVASILVFAVAACGSDDEGGGAAGGGTKEAEGPNPNDFPVDAPADLVAAAEEEGTFTFYYSGLQESMENLIDAFHEKYPGVEVQAQYYTQGAVFTRADTEIAAGNVNGDLLYLSDIDLIHQLRDKDALLDLSDLPEWQSYPDDAKEETSANTSLAAMRIGFNTDQVDSITEWQDVLDPKFEGNFIILDPRFSAVVQWFYLELQDAYGDKFLEDLAALRPQWTNSVNVGLPLVAAGELAMGFPFTQAAFPNFENKGAPVKWAETTPTTLTKTYVLGMKDGPHPNAAKLFVNYSLSEAGQVALNGNGYASSPRGDDIAGTIPVPEGANFNPGSPPEARVQKLYSLLGLQ